MTNIKAKEYSNGEITVVWKPDVCIHAGECVHGSPEVFKPKERPWISVESSSSEQIMKTIDNCPSGALSYRVENEFAAESSENETSAKIEIKAMKDGPFVFPSEGVKVINSDGNPCEIKGKSVALCRCGASANKPFCDGSHTSASFEG